jgi:hypothetical protein
LWSDGKYKRRLIASSSVLERINGLHHMRCCDCDVPVVCGFMKCGGFVCDSCCRWKGEGEERKKEDKRKLRRDEGTSLRDALEKHKNIHYYGCMLTSSFLLSLSSPTFIASI